ncbi:MAG TPA: molecular chaperone DnaJ [Magnetospirillum sp.]|nr:molecular chaperone DnaJ [Magnetospirillum sp.]
MPPQLLFLVGALAAAWLFLGWLKKAKPAAARRTVRAAGFGALMLFGLWLVLTGKVAGLVAVAAGASPWIARAIRLHGLWKMVRRMGIDLRGGRPKAGGASQVATRFVRMDLDHDSGRLDGQVLEGSLRGRLLSSLGRDEAELLWREAAADAESARVLEAWLDRAWPDWRDAGPQASEAPRGGMSHDEAREILGVGPEAAPEDIRAAHRRLMQANHPDRGGSTWIAARINQARDLLLGA